jgi:hypothetical protein
MSTQFLIHPIDSLSHRCNLFRLAYPSSMSDIRLCNIDTTQFLCPLRNGSRGQGDCDSYEIRSEILPSEEPFSQLEGY